MRGWCNLPLHEKHTELFKKDAELFWKHNDLFKKDFEVFFKHQGLFGKHQSLFCSMGSVSKRNWAIPSSVVGAGFACPKTQNKLFSGEQTSPLRTKRQHYPYFAPVCKVCTYVSVYTYGGISPHVRTHRPTRTYAWACTYIYVIVSGSVILKCRDWISLSSLLTKAFLCCIFVVRQI